MDKFSSKKALTKSNAKVGFRASEIYPLNLSAMQSNVGPSKGFLPRTLAEVVQEDEKVVEIMEEGIPPPRPNPTHFFVEAETDDGAEDVDLSQEDPPTVSNISTFLRLLQEVTTRSRTRFELLVDYSQSQILTTNDHVQTLEAIAKKKMKLL